MKRLVVAALFFLAPAGVSVPVGAAPVPNPANPCVAAIRATFAPHGAAVVNRFVAISWRESRWTPSAVNRRSMGAKWGRATGCVQILPGVARNIGVRCDLRVAVCNASAARTLWLRMGWTPWRTR